MTRDEIHAEYKRRGYRLGWTFMMTKEARLTDAKVCLVGLNPGGGHEGDEIWSCEKGNSYYDEKWSKSESYSQLQRQVHHLDKLLGLNRDGYLAAQFIPFRSKDWVCLGDKEEAIKFGNKLWTWVLAQSPAKLFLCLGRVAAEHIASLTEAHHVESYPVGWGKITVDRYLAADGRVVVRLPHPSRYAILGRQNGQSKTAERALQKACALAS